MQTGVALRCRASWWSGVRTHTGVASRGKRWNARSLQTRAGEETMEEALKRRLRESQRVEERVVPLRDRTDFNEQVLESKESLVVVEVSSEEVCQTGLEEEAELHWKQDQQLQQQELDELCRQIKHVFQRTARECTDVKFALIDPDTQNGGELCDKLGIDTIPTLQFYRRGQLLWEHKGALHHQQGLGEGVLFYANMYAGGADASDHVIQIHSREDFESFIRKEGNILKVVDVSVERAEPCIHIYPAVLALARNFKGYVSFARLLVDEANLRELGRELNIVDVPTFLFFKDGKEVERHASSSRADLIGQILSIQGMNGLPPPPPRQSMRSRRGQAAQR